MAITDWIDEARQVAAQCWCDDDTSGIEIDARLAEAVARRIAAWMDTAAQARRDSDYYRGLAGGEPNTPNAPLIGALAHPHRADC